MIWTLLLKINTIYCSLNFLFHTDLLTAKSLPCRNPYSGAAQASYFAQLGHIPQCYICHVDVWVICLGNDEQLPVYRREILRSDGLLSCQLVCLSVCLFMMTSPYLVSKYRGQCGARAPLWDRFTPIVSSGVLTAFVAVGYCSTSPFPESGMELWCLSRAVGSVLDVIKLVFKGTLSNLCFRSIGAMIGNCNMLFGWLVVATSGGLGLIVSGSTWKFVCLVNAGLPLLWNCNWALWIQATIKFGRFSTVFCSRSSFCSKFVTLSSTAVLFACISDIISNITFCVCWREIKRKQLEIWFKKYGM